MKTLKIETNIKDFDFDQTIYEYDYFDYLFQKKHKTIVRKKYDSLYLPHFFVWGETYDIFLKKAIKKNGYIISAREYIHAKVMEKLEKRLNKKIPKLLLTKQEEGNEYIFISRCAGREKEREIIEKILYGELSNDLNDKIVSAYLKEIEKYTFSHCEKGVLPGEKIDIFIIGDIEVAKRIKFKSFFKDFEDNEQHYNIVKNIINELYKLYKRNLDWSIENVK